MRNYWMRIVLGALAIFTIGMIARALINRGLGGVRSVVGGSGPLSIPLAFIPFQLGGEKLGTLERVTLERVNPRHVTSVELEIKLTDSLLARGLEGCRLAANLDSKDGHRRVSNNTFWCAEKPSTDTTLVEYGHAVFHPGEVSVPLYLPRDLVDELQNIDFGEDSVSSLAEAQAEAAMDAEEEAIEAQAESAVTAERARVEPSVRRAYRDSIRLEGQRRADSTRRVIIRVADSTHSR